MLQQQGESAGSVTALLNDGTEVELRPVRPEDKELLQQGMAMLSPASRRLRFMAPIENLSRSQLTYLTELDHHWHLAWGVTFAGQPVAVGRLVRMRGSGETAEIALTVLDAWQGRGVGKLLVKVLAEVGRSVGIERIEFEALPDNTRIVQLLKSFGAVPRLEEGVVTGSFEIGSIESTQVHGGKLLDLAEVARTTPDPQSDSSRSDRSRPESSRADSSRADQVSSEPISRSTKSA